jgi:hypothetical protein
MIRVLTALALGLICSVNAQAALLASYNFNLASPGLGATTVAPGVTAGAFTSSAPGSVNRAGNAALFAQTNSTSSFVNQATVQISQPVLGIHITQIKFDLARAAGANVGNGTVFITNNINGETFTATSTSTTFGTQTWNLSPGVTSLSPIIFTFSQRWDGIGPPATRTQLRIDNFEINGTVTPEPASMAVFGILGLAGVAYRRRMKANA